MKILLITGLSLLSTLYIGLRASEKSNIILIMSDDQAWGDFETNGNNIIDTPNLNKIASEGIQFDRFYVAPMCAPTRASLLTGRYNLRCGTSWVGRRTEMLALNEVTIADIFKKAGYKTGCFGKWHLGLYSPYHPTERGFDEFIGFLNGSINNYFYSRLNNKEKQFFTDNEYVTDYLTDRALDFIQSNRKQPFFCYIPYNVPHHPFQVPDKYYKKYIERGVSDERTAAVYAMIDNMDVNIGRIMAKLRELKLDENTIIIFLSDNGPQFGRFNDGLKGIKAQVSEGSTRVPLYLRWKSHLPENMHIYDIASVTDVLPTLLELTVIEVPDSIAMDGISLMPLIKGQPNQGSERMIFTHQTIFGNTWITPGSVRTQKYRIVNNGDDQWELFDMDTDPSQKRNIAAKNPEILEKLKKHYENWFLDVTSNWSNSPPIPIGFHGEDTVIAVAPDAVLIGSIEFNNKYGWDGGWIQNWKNTNDSVIWPIEVYTTGVYEFNLLYTCEETSIGSEMQICINNKQIMGTILNAHTSKLLDLPNVIPKLSQPEKESWATLKLGRLKLHKGITEIVLQAIKIPGNKAGEFLALEIIKIDSQ